MAVDNFQKYTLQLIRFSVALSALSRLSETSLVAPRYYTASPQYVSFETAEQVRRPLRQQISTEDFYSSNTNQDYANFGNVPCLFRIKVPHTKLGDTVKIVGASPSLGNWRTDRALSLTTTEHDFPWYLIYRCVANSAPN